MSSASPTRISNSVAVSWKGTCLSDVTSLSGVFPSQWIRAAVENGIIRGEQPIEAGQIQRTVSICGSEHGLSGAVQLSAGKEGIYRKLDAYRWYEFTLQDEGMVLEKNQAYIFPLNESLHLPDDVYARANPQELDRTPRCVHASGHRIRHDVRTK